jgi:hypothetical protein
MSAVEHVHHLWRPGRGISCGSCDANFGDTGPLPWWFTCGQCGLAAPIDDFNLMPGMPDAHPEHWCQQCDAGSPVKAHALAQPKTILEVSDPGLAVFVTESGQTAAFRKIYFVMRADEKGPPFGPTLRRDVAEREAVAHDDDAWIVEVDAVAVFVPKPHR